MSSPFDLSELLIVYPQLNIYFGLVFQSKSVRHTTQVQTLTILRLPIFFSR